MINISTTFSFHHLHKPFIFSQFPLQKKIPSYYNSEFWIFSSNIKDSSMSLFYVKSSKVIFSFSTKLQYAKEKKRREEEKENCLYEKEEKKRQKERRKEKEEKNKESEKKEKYGKTISAYLYPSTTIPFLPCVYPFYHSTPSRPILSILFYHHHLHHLGE